MTGLPLLADVRVAAPDIFLAPTIGSSPEATLSLLSIAGGTAFVAVEADAFDAVEDALAADPSVEDFAVVSERPGRRIYRVEPVAEPLALSTALGEFGIRPVEATGQDGGWRLRLELPDREAIQGFRRYCRERDIDFRLENLFRQSPDDAGAALGLTDDQLETLRTAYRRGYFEVPRAVTQEELAASLGVSDSAISHRLRRAIAALVEESRILDE